MGVRCGWGLVAASPLWVFRDRDLPAHELPIRFMGARREKIRGCLCRKLCRVGTGPGDVRASPSRTGLQLIEWWVVLPGSNGAVGQVMS